MLIVRLLDVGQPLQQPALRNFQGPYINNYPGRYLSVHRIRSKYLSITLDPGHYFSKHWMRVLPIAESPRGGFIPYIFTESDQWTRSSAGSGSSNRVY